MNNNTIVLALFGFGTVGREVADYIINESHTLSEHTHYTIILKYIYTRSTDKVHSAGVDPALLCENWQRIIEDPEIDGIIELMGGTGFAKQVLLHAIQHKKHIITANKALLAEHGEALWRAARINNVNIAFEASCGGGIPIIRAITDGLVANKISAIYGVLNGTCNFILTEMDKKGWQFNNALQAAQELGLAEAEPSLDIDGFDAAHKIAIMSGLSFNTKVDIHVLPTKGITDVQNIDIEFGKILHYTMKLIAAGVCTHKNTISIWVHPAFLPDTHPMATIEGPFNAISIVGHEVGHTLYSGRGAGGKPTASAIIADIIATANGTSHAVFTHSTIWPDINTQHIQTDMGDLSVPAYIRLSIADTLGVLAQVASVLTEYHISIARVLQEDYPHTVHATKSCAALIIITHTTVWSAIVQACEKLELLSIVHDTPSYYPIIEQTKDFIT